MKEKISFSEITKQVYDVYGEQSVLPIIFGVASIYRDRIVSITGSFPVLYLKGGFATGKTSLAVAIQTIFSESNSMLSEKLKVTDLQAAFTTKGIAILDEYNGSLKFDGAIKANYDDVKIFHGTNNNKIETIKFDSSLIITSAVLPGCQTVLGRTVLVSKENSDYSQYQREKFSHLHGNLYRKNCNCVQELLDAKSYTTIPFEFLYSQCKIEFLPFSEIGNQRIKDNYATLIAVFENLEGFLNFPFSKEKLIDVLAKCMLEHDLFLKPSKYTRL